MVPIGDSLHLEVKLGEHWRPVYSFDSVDYYPVDFEAANWQVSTYPASEFVRNRRRLRVRPGIIARFSGNTQLSIRHPDGAVEKTRRCRMLLNCVSTLTTMFGISADLQI